MRNAISLSLTLLSGCDVVDGFSAEQRISDFNEAYLFDPTALARELPESAITRPFPFNAYYSEDKAPQIDPADFRLAITGLVENKMSWTLEELYALPRFTQITRDICIEGWNAIGK